MESNIDSLSFSITSRPARDKIEVLHNLIEEYADTNQYEKAVEHLKELISLLQKEDPEIPIATYYKRLGKFYFKLDKYDDAKENYEIALYRFQQHQNQYQSADLFSEIGFVNQSQGNYLEANEYYSRALDIFEQIADSTNVALILNRIGSTYKFIEEYDKALEYYYLALEIRKKINYQRGIAGSLNNIGTIYLFKAKYQKALELYFQALELNEEMENDSWISFNLNNIGYIYYLQSKYSEALEYMKRSLQIKGEIKDLRGQMHTLGNIASVYNAIGDNELTTEYLDQSLKLAKKIGSKQHLLQCYRDLAIHNEQNKNFAVACDYLNSYISLNDSLFNQEKIAAIQELQTKYETTKKGKEIELLKKKSEIHKIKLRRNRILKFTFIVGFIIILALAMIIFFSYRRARSEIEKRKIIQKKLNELNKNLENRVEMEVKTRRAQEQKAIEQSRLAALGELAAGIAHEINQPLHSIAFSMDNMALALEEDDADKNYLQKKTERIFEDIDRMKRIIDHIRTFSRKQTDEKEVLFNINSSINNAVNMIKEQYSNQRIDLKIDLDPKLPDVLGNVYRFEQVVLILLSNGKFAVEKQENFANGNFRKKLKINTFYQKNFVIMEFSDNGIGIPEENIHKIFDPFFTTKKQDKGTGLGLSIASSIVSEMGGNILVKSESNKGTKITIKIKKGKL